MDYNIGPLSQIPPGEGRNFQLGGVRVAVFRTHADEVFATQPDCPHRAGPLADGLIGGTTVMCPLHDRAWNLRDGSPLGTDCALATYPARLLADRSVAVAVP